MRIISLLALLAWPASAQNLMNTYAGTSWTFPARSIPGLQAPLGKSNAIASDSQGNVYIADSDNQLVFQVDRQGTLQVIAGNGVSGFSGDGGSALNAALRFPQGIAVDGNGEVYIADSGNNRIRRVSTNGIITTIAGTGSAGFSGDGGDARQARLNYPETLTFDSAGNLYFIDYFNYRIRVIRTDGTIQTVAGTGKYDSTGDGGPALRADIVPDWGLAVNDDGVIYFSEKAFDKVRAIDAAGVVRTIAGNGTYDFARNGGVAVSSPIRDPGGLVLDSRGTVYFAESNGYRVFRITASGDLQVVAGTLELGYTGDGGPAASASLGFPYALAFDPSGKLFVFDHFCLCLRSFTVGGTIASVAGNGKYGRTPDGTPAARTSFFGPRGLVFDRRGSLIVANYSTNRLDILTPQRISSLLAGRAAGCCLDGGQARDALVSSPVGVAVDAQNRVYFSQAGFSIVRRIDPDGIITTYAGNRSVGFGGDNGQASRATLSGPAGLAIDSAGSLYIADQFNYRIRRVTAAGVISTYAGNGQARYAGDAGTAVNASFSSPYALALLANGDLLVADVVDRRIRKISAATGIVTTIAGNGSASSTGDGGPATQAGINAPSGLAVDPQGRIYVLERDGNRIRRIDTNGVITTVAGNGTRGFTGDGGPATLASTNAPQMGIAIDANGDVLFSDTANNVIRAVRVVAPRISVDRNSVTISTRARQLLTPSVIQVRSTTIGVLFQAKVRTARGGNWLSLDADSGAAPAELRLRVDAGALDPGIYTGAIEITSAVADPGIITVPVTLAVLTPPITSVLSADTTNLTFSLDGESSQERSISMTTDGADLRVTVTASTVSGGEWLRVTQDSVVVAGGGASITAAVSSDGLRAGTYSGNITLLSGAQQLRIPVTLVVKPTARSRILLSQSGLSYFAVAKGSAPPSQMFGILNEGSGDLVWTARAVTLSGGDWLRLDGTSGRVNQPLLDVSSVNASIQPAGLAAGDYYGRIEITSASENSPQYLTVVLRVLPEGSTPPPEVRPTGLIFATTEGSNPGSQMVSVTNLLSSTAPFASSRLTFDGADWFTHSPSNAAVEANSPRSMVVQPELSELTPGVRRGVVTLLFEDGAARNVSLLSVVAPPGSLNPAKAGNSRALGNCGKDDLLISFTSLRNDFSAVVGQPTTVEVRIVDSCGSPLLPQSKLFIKAAIIDNSSSTNLVHIGNGVWQGSITPTKTSSGALLRVVVNLANQLSTADRACTIQQVGRTPQVVQGSLRHSASFETDVPVAPGELITIIGTNLADGTNSSTLPHPSELNQTEVLLGGRSLPLLYVSDNQINAQVPYDLVTSTQHQLLVRRGNTSSVPEPFVVAEAQPGIFTRNASGVGQGTITRPDGSFVEPGTPARRGDELIVYCTGLGQVTPRLEPGEPAPNPGPRVVADVSVSIGGTVAEVKSATLTPGFAGSYQVRFVVPPNAPTGDEVSVVVTAAGRSSQPVTMAVR